jgi:hypothetical protein
MIIIILIIVIILISSDDDAFYINFVILLHFMDHMSCFFHCVYAQSPGGPVHRNYFNVLQTVCKSDFNPQKFPGSGRKRDD